MKILFITAEYFPLGAGAGRSVRNLAEGVAATGHEAIVACLTPEKAKSVETINGVKVYHLPIRNIYWPDNTPKNVIKKLIWHCIDAFNPWAMKDIAHVLEEEKPDIVNTNSLAGFSTGVVYTIKKRGIPLAHTLRDYYLLCIRSSMFKNGRDMEGISTESKPFLSFRKRAAKSVDLFLGNSDFVLRRHKRFGLISDSQGSTVQWNANDNDEISKPKTGRKINTIRFGFIGRIDPVKGLEDLLIATNGLSSKAWELKIAGNGQEQYIQKLKDEYLDPRIEFLGVQDADEFYGSIDVLVCPSVYAEPLPRVIYEAYRAGVPVIASDKGGIPEIVEEGKTGHIYSAHDTVALAELMDKIAQDQALYNKLSEGALEKAQDFTRSSVTRSFLDKLEPLLHQKEA